MTDNEVMCPISDGIGPDSDWFSEKWRDQTQTNKGMHKIDIVQIQ